MLLKQKLTNQPPPSQQPALPVEKQEPASPQRVTPPRVRFAGVFGHAAKAGLALQLARLALQYRARIKNMRTV